MKKNTFIQIIVLSIVIRVVLSFIGWHPDVNNHVDWGIRFFEYGAQGFYSPDANVWSFTWPNQPPLTILTFALVKKLFDVVFSLLLAVNTALPAFPSGVVLWSEDYLMHVLVKLPAVISDFGISWLIYKFVKDFSTENKARWAASMFLLNPVVWYNSALWGQTDATINFFGILALYLIYKNKYLPATIVFTLSLLMKISLAIYIPLIAIIYLRSKKPVSIITISAIAVLLTCVLTAIPFSTGNPIVWLITLYREKVLDQQLQLITANAFNLWAVLSGIDEISHFTKLGPLTHASWGYLLFLISYIPLLWILYRKPTIKTLLWTLMLAGFSAFLLLTNMHERYLYPIFPLFTIIIFVTKDLVWKYITISGINFLNLYHLWWMPRIEYIPQILGAGSHAIPRTLAIVSLYLYITLYLKFLRLSRSLKL